MNNVKKIIAVLVLFVFLFCGSSCLKRNEIITEVKSEEYDLTVFDAVKDGDLITFGTYEQDNDSSNGPEPIEWIVLHKSSKEMIVISKYILNAGIVSWDNDMNKPYMHFSSAFSEIEKTAICFDNGMNIKNENYPTFALSVSDVIGYMSMEERKADVTIAAKYSWKGAVKNSDVVWITSTTYKDDPSTQYEDESEYFFAVNMDGEFCQKIKSKNLLYYGFRPAMILKISPTAQYFNETAAVKGGDFVTFGSYEQDGNYANGTEKLQWVVLDRKDDCYLLISRYIIDYGNFHDSSSDYYYESPLREWLNGEFCSRAFSSQEYNQIQYTEVKFEGISPDVTDRVFLLNIEQIENYVLGTGFGKQTEPTELASQFGAHGNYWTMYSTGSPAYVTDASVWDVGTFNAVKTSGIRPAVWVKLS